jgi:hypothetical protein
MMLRLALGWSGRAGVILICLTAFESLCAGRGRSQ